MSDPGPPGGATPVFAVAAAALGAALLFVVQPMFARLLLPRLGGAPAVWIVCATFYQLAVLAGYLYAHALGRIPASSRQGLAHLTLLLAAALFLPPSLRGGSAIPPAEPLGWLLARLAAGVGPLVVLLAATSPLLASWLAGSGHPEARDPYFLYAGSNAGSLVGLLAYPMAIEPLFSSTGQAHVWSAGYGLFVGLAVVCAARLGRAPAPPAPPEAVTDPPSLAARLRWVFLAFVPSTLYLGFTTWATTDLAPVPLLWVLPLAVYLGSFVAAFARRPVPRRRALLLAVQPLALFAVGIAGFASKGAVSLPALGGHFLVLAICCLVSHRELAEGRPPAGRLTEYYVWIALGGVLGGLFTSLVAPRLFNSAAEYPLALVLTVLCRPSRPRGGGPDRRALVLDVVLPLGALVVLLEVGRALQGGRPGVAGTAAVPFILAVTAVVCALPFLVRAGRRFALAAGLGAVILAATLQAQGHRHTLFADRSFFGVHRVRQEGTLHVLLHGDTQHGVQNATAAGRREPLGYHTRASPVGELLASARPFRDVAVVGLGAGALAAYGRPGQTWTFYELDPMVERIARDPALFTYLRDCQAATRVIVGDARLSLAGAAPGAHDILVLDAFSSDAVPVHLVTREAVALYLSKVASAGLIVFNVSNRYLRLGPILAAIGRDLGLSTWMASDLEVPAAERAGGRLPSEWVVMARASTDLSGWTTSTRWRVLGASAGARAWTDQFSNLLSALRLP